MGSCGVFLGCGDKEEEKDEVFLSLDTGYDGRLAKFTKFSPI